jgi:hypothetical protein
MARSVTTKISNPTAWRGLPAEGPAPSDFGLSPLAENVDSIAHRRSSRRSRIAHGIGGGMRIVDDFTEPMSHGNTFSRDWMDRRLSLTKGRLFLGLYMAFVVTVCCLLHVNLRFRIHDLLVQQRLIQTNHREFARQAMLLERHNNFLSDPERLRNYALSKLDMEKMDSTEPAMEVTVSSAVERRYDPVILADAQQREAQSRLAAAPDTFHSKNVVAQLVDIGRTLTTKMSGE